MYWMKQGDLLDMVQDLVTLEVLDGLVRHCLPVLSIWLLLIYSLIMKKFSFSFNISS